MWTGPSSSSSAGEFLAAAPPLLFYYLRTYPVLVVTTETKKNNGNALSCFPDNDPHARTQPGWPQPSASEVALKEEKRRKNQMLA